MKTKLNQRKNINMQKADDSHLRKVSKYARINKMKPHLKKKILENAEDFLKENPKKQKKTVTMIDKQIKLLQTLSKDLKVPQGEVLEKLLEEVRDERFKAKFYAKFKSY